ncbi:MAG: DUF2304 domain-containing protein [Acidobacteria bacterium]|nr:DUF2304 domain-containing protein [Acidobacteriota bacterium]
MAAEAGALLVDALAILTIAWIFQLVRRDRLYVGYGVIFVLVIAAGLVLLTFPVVRRPIDWIGALALGAPALLALAIAFLVLMLIYVLGQLTQVSNRLSRLTQELAIRDALDAGGTRRPRGDAAGDE